MNNSYNYLKELKDFFEGTFHQDISSPEQALDEFINEVSKECLVSTINDCKEFLNSNLTRQEKEDFIKVNTEIYFPVIELTPLQWLCKLVERIQEAEKTK